MAWMASSNGLVFRLSSLPYFHYSWWIQQIEQFSSICISYCKTNKVELFQTNKSHSLREFQSHVFQKFRLKWSMIELGSAFLANIKICKAVITSSAKSDPQYLEIGRIVHLRWLLVSLRMQNIEDLQYVSLGDLLLH